ncbi:MAG: DUF2062 domain-containing protein [Rikenellaceae bacterium]
MTKNSDSNLRIASAIGLGVAFGIIPIWGYQMIAVAAVAHLFRLNKVIALVCSNISIPPMIPFILYGSFYVGAVVCGRECVVDFSNISFDSISQDLLQYIVGAMLLAVVAGALLFVVSYSLLSIFRKK